MFFSLLQKQLYLLLVIAFFISAVFLHDRFTISYESKSNKEKYKKLNLLRCKVSNRKVARRLEFSCDFRLRCDDFDSSQVESHRCSIYGSILHVCYVIYCHIMLWSLKIDFYIKFNLLLFLAWNIAGVKIFFWLDLF